MGCHRPVWWQRSRPLSSGLLLRLASESWDFQGHSILNFLLWCFLSPYQALQELGRRSLLKQSQERLAGSSAFPLIGCFLDLFWILCLLATFSIYLLACWILDQSNQNIQTKRGQTQQWWCFTWSLKLVELWRHRSNFPNSLLVLAAKTLVSCLLQSLFTIIAAARISGLNFGLDNPFV